MLSSQGHWRVTHSPAVCDTLAIKGTAFGCWQRQVLGTRAVVWMLLTRWGRQEELKAGGRCPVCGVEDPHTSGTT